MKPALSLKHRLFLVYITTMFLFTSVLCSYVYIRNRNYTWETLKSNYQNTASFLTNDIEAELDTLSSYSYILSRNPSLIQLLLNPHDIYEIVVSLNADIEPTIQFILNSSKAIKGITIYTDETEKQIPSPYFENVTQAEDTIWYKTITGLDGPHIFCEGEQLYIITPIRNYHSQRIDTGFVKMDIDATSLATAALSKHKDLQFSLFNDAGDVLFSTLEIPVSEDYFSLGQNTLRSAPVTITFHIHSSLMQLPTGEILLPALTILIASLLLSYLFMRYMNRKMFSRLETIMEQINRVDADNFIITIDDQTDDEIGALAVCINRMSKKIDTMFTELTAAKNRELRAEIEALRARIDPHFLYNILNTINWIAMDGNTDQVCAITHELAIYYRTNLNDGKSISSIGKEIENVKAYLNLQEIATSHAFDVVYHIDEELLGCETCDFILQPLVENAITHGIKPLKGRRGTITIDLYEKENTIYLSVTDNGVGLRSPSAKGSVFKKTHYGIKNINLRISLTFGENYGVSLVPGPNGLGAVATICLPKKPAPPFQN